MLSLHKTPVVLLIIGFVATLLAYSTIGVGKASEAVRWLDVVAEGGTSLMAGIWFLMTISSRPRGKVTSLLAAGLGLIMLGAWADCLDEFFKIGKDQLWDHWLEAVFTLGGMVVLTTGLYFWRQEQFSLNTLLQKRERLFRDHQAFDRLTQLVNAHYLRRLIQLERERQPELESSVALLDINNFHKINREHGVDEGDRVLQALSHMLLLNLSNQDLLCRYAGDRFAIYMPDTTVVAAQQKVKHLCAMVQQMHYFTQANAPMQQLSLSLRAACGNAEQDLDGLLNKLSSEVEAHSNCEDSQVQRAQLSGLANGI